MNKLTWLILLTFLSATKLTAQQKPLSGKTIIEKALKEIKDFNTNESKKDSISGHLLGSNKEEDFQRRYKFYQSVYSKLNGIHRASVSFNDGVNLELLQYSIEDEISSYTFKTYLNPILSDEGFHTELAAMGSEVLSSKKEFEKYITKLKDIPRYVDENIALMEKGIELGISQPRSILNGYENTYEQHIVDDVEKSVFWKPFLQKPFAINNDDWKKIRDEGRQAIQQYAVEGFRKIKAFFDNEYLPKTRTTIGVSISLMG
jgi:uncharacterized protein (DUF885 family)